SWLCFSCVAPTFQGASCVHLWRRQEPDRSNSQAPLLVANVPPYPASYRQFRHRGGGRSSSQKPSVLLGCRVVDLTASYREPSLPYDCNLRVEGIPFLPSTTLHPTLSPHC